MNKLILFVMSFIVSLFSMQPEVSVDIQDLKDILGEITYRCAELRDQESLLELINTEAVIDSTKIVIVPEKFRRRFLQAALEKKRMFVAEHQGIIVGYKKLFLMNDPDEKHAILSDEIRCINNEEGCAFVGYGRGSGQLIENKSSQIPDQAYTVCIYNGGDFTHPLYRRKGINQSLTQHALYALMPTIQETLTYQKSNAFSMVFGITNANAGQFPGGPSDRTPSICRVFNAFIDRLEGASSNRIFYHRRYHAFMPTFDAKSEELKPLPDEQAISGYGCVIAYDMKENHE